MFIKFKQICVLHFFFHSQRIQITWQNEMLLLAVVFLHGWLRRALPVSLSQVCLWDVCGRPCWPSRHRKMHNWQRKFNILYLKWEEFRAARASRRLSFFFLLLLLPRVSLSSLLGWSEETVFYNNGGLLTSVGWGVRRVSALRSYSKKTLIRLTWTNTIRNIQFMG